MPIDARLLARVCVRVQCLSGSEVDQRVSIVAGGLGRFVARAWEFVQVWRLLVVVVGGLVVGSSTRELVVSGQWSVSCGQLVPREYEN